MRFMLYRLTLAADNRAFENEVAVLNAWGRNFKLSSAAVNNLCGACEVEHIS